MKGFLYRAGVAVDKMGAAARLAFMRRITLHIGYALKDKAVK